MKGDGDFVGRSLSNTRLDYRACTEYGAALRHLLNTLLDFATQCSQSGSEALLHQFFQIEKDLNLFACAA